MPRIARPAERTLCARENSIREHGLTPGRTGRVFLLSPANIEGRRADLVLNGNAQFELARSLRGTGAPLGAVFSFISGLYFRGKMAYAQAFARPLYNISGTLVITSSAGLVAPETIVNVDRLREISAVDLDPGDARYRDPLVRDARMLSQAAGADCEFVLLGSIATPKYVGPLQDIFGEKLLFPADFVGRGDLSRGGLLLRCVRTGTELSYLPVAGVPRHGPRPLRLQTTSATSAE